MERRLRLASDDKNVEEIDDADYNANYLLLTITGVYI